MSEQALVLKKRANLTKGQHVLYGLICKKLETNDVILLQEIKDIYVHYACREVRNGVPYTYNFWWKKENEQWLGRYEPMTSEQVTLWSLKWITQNIGSLVLKGYLKVLPQLQLTEGAI